jgi:hypothetical protein
MACQNQELEIIDFVSQGKTAFLPWRTEKMHGCNFSVR